MEQKITLDSSVVAIKDQVSADLSGEAAILNLKTGIYYGLNEVGTRIWNLIQAPRTVKAVKDSIIQEYDVEPDKCERDLLSLLTDLLSRGLIELV